jgi:hypothetical protein
LQQRSFHSDLSDLGKAEEILLLRGSFRLEKSETDAVGIDLQALRYLRLYW